MTRLFLLMTVCVSLCVLFPPSVTPASLANDVTVDAVIEPSTSRVPSATESWTHGREGLMGDTSMAPWQREFMRQLVGYRAPQPPVTAESGPNGPSGTDGAWSQIMGRNGRVDHTAIYDPVRDRMIVFGGWDDKYKNDVWALSLDASPAWTELTPSGTPPGARRGHSAIYDPVRDRMIVFGGIGPYRNDVWALSLGASPAWTELTPTGTPPSGRMDHTAVYDPVRDRMVVYGGWDGNYRDDVWVLSLGASPAWTALAPTGTPPTGRRGHTAIYDSPRDRMVVFGGMDGDYQNDVWALSIAGSPAWTELTPTGTPPSGRSDHTAVYDPIQDRMVVYSEWDGHVALLNDLWELSLGASPTWTEITATNIRPAGRWAHTAIYHPAQDRMVVFGGYPNYANDVWVLSLVGSPTWTEITPPGSPPNGRAFHTTIYDPVRDRLIVCGGYPNEKFDAWELTLGGTPVWTDLAPSGTPPSGRKNSAAIYDPVRDRMIMYAGFLTYPDDPTDPQLRLNDVWELSLGASPAWTELFPTGGPPAKREAHVAVYDPVRDRMVVFGGYSVEANDTWALSLDASPAWTELTPSGPLPIERARHAAIYDPVRDRMILYGGYDQVLNCLDDVWELSLGASPAWTELTPTGTPPIGRGRHSAIYDPVRDRMVVFGAYDCDWVFRNDLWELSLGASPAWRELLPFGTPPTKRSGHSATYDPVRDRMVVFAGVAGYHTNDVWELTWSPGSCGTPEIVSYDPSLVTSDNCSDGCTVSFIVDTPDDYSGVEKITLERYLEGMWILEDSQLAPLPAPTWTLTCDIDEHYTDGEHVFHVVFHCVDGSKSVSETATVLAQRGVPVAIQEFVPEYSAEGVVLRWSIGNGVTLRGFNIYRSLRAERGFERINERLIDPGEGNQYTDGDVSPGETYWYQLGAVDADGEWTSQTVSLTIPGWSLALHQNVPNPFNPTTSIKYSIAQRGHVSLKIYNAAGQLVRTLVDEMQTPVQGGFSKIWKGLNNQGEPVSSGVYFYRLVTTNFTQTKKMVLLK